MAPVESVDTATGEIVGFEPELARAIARRLNVKVEIQNVAWDGLLAGMQAGRFDIAMSGITDSPQRQQAMDFVDWYSSGAKLIVPKGNPKKVSGIDSLCGLTLAGVRATSFYKIMEAAAAKCGSKETPLIATDSTPAGLLLLKSGRADVLALDALASVGFLKVNPELESATENKLNPDIHGVAFAKTNAALRDAWQAGLNAIIDSGEYDAILKRFDSSDVAYKKATVNAGQ
jgi:polar amino acid transport system substrate-binding protein